MFETYGLNHITIFVSQLERSLDFYQTILRMKLVHQGIDYAYLESGSTWFCLSQKPLDHQPNPSLGPDHVALTVKEDDFEAAVAHLREHNVPIVRGPIIRGIGKTVNFLDPDGLQWEFHTSNLAERMTIIEQMDQAKAQPS